MLVIYSSIYEKNDVMSVFIGTRNMLYYFSLYNYAYRIYILLDFDVEG